VAGRLSRNFDRDAVVKRLWRVSQRVTMKKIESISELPDADFPCHGDLYVPKRLIAAAFKVWSLKRRIDPDNYYEGPNWFKYKRAWKERNNNDEATRGGRYSLLQTRRV